MSHGAIPLADFGDGDLVILLALHAVVVGGVRPGAGEEDVLGEVEEDAGEPAWY
jgi:hypothetical protein